MWTGLAAAVVALVGTAIAAGVNYKSQQKTNQVNQEINQTNLDYNAAQTQAAWERDDTAHQREVADLQAAGLSPIASLNGAQTSAPLGAPAPIAMQAPQIDTSALLQGVMNMANLEETKRHNQATESARSSELQLEAEKINQSAQSLQIENKKVESEIKYYARLNELEAGKLDELVRSNKKGEDIKLSEHEAHMLEVQSKMYLEDINKQLGGFDVPYDEIYDFDVYVARKKLLNVQFSHFLEKIGATQEANASSYGYNQSDSFGLNGGATVAGTGGNAGMNWSETTGENQSNYSMKNLSEKQKAEWYNFFQEHHQVVFIDKSKYDRMFKD